MLPDDRKQIKQTAPGNRGKIKRGNEMKNPISKESTKKQKAHKNWMKAIGMAQIYQDSLMLCEDKTDLPYLEKQESEWNQKAKEFRAIYLKSV